MMNPPIPWSGGLGWPLGFNMPTSPSVPNFGDGPYQPMQPREFSLRGYAEWRAENAKVEAARILTYLHTNKTGPKDMNPFAPEYIKHTHEHLHNNKSFMIDSLLSRQDAAARVAVERALVSDPQNRLALNLSTNAKSLCVSKQSKGESKVGKDNSTNYNKNCRPHPYPQNICGGHNRNLFVFQNKQQPGAPNMETVPVQNNLGSSTPVPPDESLSGEKCRSSSPQSARRATKAKRVRTIFTPEQLEKLEAEFERQQYMVGPERLYLASSLSLSEAQVKVWFQNRRIKWRKQHLELQQQRLAALRSQQADLETEESEDYGDSESPTPTPASPSVAEVSPSGSQVPPPPPSSRVHYIPLPTHLSPLTKAYFYVASPEKCERELDPELNSHPSSPSPSKIPGSPQANGI